MERIYKPLETLVTPYQRLSIQEQEMLVERIRRTRQEVKTKQGSKAKERSLKTLLQTMTEEQIMTLKSQLQK